MLLKYCKVKFTMFYFQSFYNIKLQKILTLSCWIDKNFDCIFLSRDSFHFISYFSSLLVKIEDLKTRKIKSWNKTYFFELVAKYVVKSNIEKMIKVDLKSFLLFYASNCLGIKWNHFHIFVKIHLFLLSVQFLIIWARIC